MTASRSYVVKSTYKNNQTHDLTPIGNNTVLKYPDAIQHTHKTKRQYGKGDVKTGCQGNAQVFDGLQQTGGWKQGIRKLHRRVIKQHFPSSICFPAGVQVALNGEKVQQFSFSINYFCSGRTPHARASQAACDGTWPSIFLHPCTIARQSSLQPTTGGGNQLGLLNKEPQLYQSPWFLPVPSYHLGGTTWTEHQR